MIKWINKLFSKKIKPIFTVKDLQEKIKERGNMDEKLAPGESKPNQTNDGK